QADMAKLPGMADDIRAAVIKAIGSINSFGGAMRAATAAAQQMADRVEQGAENSKKLLLEFADGRISSYFKDGTNSANDFIKKISGGTEAMGTFALKTALLVEPMVGLLPVSADVFGKIGSG